MAEPMHLRESPLTHLTAAMAAGSGPAVSLTERPFRTMVAIQVEATSGAAARIAEVLGCALPSTVGTTATSEGRTVLWLGPTEWLVVADPSDSEPQTLTDALADARGGEPGTVVDVSANRTTLVLTGERARAVLETGCPADLHPRSFAPGTAVTTTLGPVPLLLWRTAIQEYRLLPRASFADYTARWLLDAMLEHTTRG